MRRGGRGNPRGGWRGAPMNFRHQSPGFRGYRPQGPGPDGLQRFPPHTPRPWQTMPFEPNRNVNDHSPRKDRKYFYHNNDFNHHKNNYGHPGRHSYHNNHNAASQFKSYSIEEGMGYWKHPNQLYSTETNQSKAQSIVSPQKSAGGISFHKESSQMFDAENTLQRHNNTESDLSQNSMKNYSCFNTPTQNRGNNFQHQNTGYYQHRLNYGPEQSDGKESTILGYRRPQLAQRTKSFDSSHDMVDYSQQLSSVHSARSTHLSEGSETFTRSVSDTVNIVKEKLMNRNTFTPTSSSVTQNVDAVDNLCEEPDNQNTEIMKIRRKSQRKPNINTKTNERIKNKIVNELLQKVNYGDKGSIQKLVDNPSLSSKVECAINSLITESQNSLKRHTRAAAEKNLYAGDKFINNDTIYEDTFIKQMQCVLDPTDTIILSDLKPFVMAELNKILQVDEYEQSGIPDDEEMLQMADAYKDFYCVPKQEVDYEISPEQETHSYLMSDDTDINSYHSESNANKSILEGNMSTPEKNKRRKISISDYKHEKELMANNRRTSANISGSEENVIKPDLFNITGEPISEDDDPFADLDNQYHVAVDPSFIDQDCTKIIEENDDCNNMFLLEHASTIAQEVSNRNTEHTIKIEVDDPDYKHDDSSQFLHASSNNRGDSSRRDKEKSHKRPHEDKVEHRKEKRKKTRHHSKEKEVDSKKQSKITEHLSYSDKYVKRKESEKSDKTNPKKSDKNKHNHESKKLDNMPKLREKAHKRTDVSQKKSECLPKKSDNLSKKSEFIVNTNTTFENLPIKIENESDDMIKSPEISIDKPGHLNSLFNENSLSEIKSEDKDKSKFRNIDIFSEIPRQVQIHQAPRNTATVPSVKVGRNVDISKNRRHIKSTNKPTRSIGIQVEFKRKTQETQTETIINKNKSVQINLEVTKAKKSIDRKMTSVNLQNRIKDIDSEIKLLLQEKVKLVNSIETKDLDFDLGISIMDIGNISPKGDIGNISEDAIIELANMPEEELEQIAFQGLADPAIGPDTIAVTPYDKNVETKEHIIEPEVTKSTVTKSPIVKTRMSKRRLKQSPSPEKPLIKEKRPAKKNRNNKAKVKIPQGKKKIKKTYNFTRCREYNYEEKIKSCWVVLTSSDFEVVNEFLKMGNKTMPQEAIENERKEVENNEINDLEDIEMKDLVMTETEESFVKEIVPVSNEFQYQDFSMVISEDIEINDGGDLSQFSLSDEIVVDNSTLMSDRNHEDAEQNAAATLKVYDFMGEELSRDCINVSCTSDTVLALKCIENNFLAACLDGNVHHIDTNGHLIRTLKVSNFGVSCMSIVKNNGRYMVYTGSLDSRIRCYDLETGIEKGQECHVLSPIQSMDYNWETIFVGTRTGFVLQFGCRNNMLIPVRTTQYSEKTILALRAIKEGPRKILVIGTRSDNVTIKDVVTGLLLRTLVGPKMTIYSLLFENGKIFCGTIGNSIHIFDFATGSYMGDLVSGRGCVCLETAGTLIFAGCYDGCIYVFKQGDFTPFAQLCGPQVMVTSLFVTSTKILAGYNNQKFFIWKIPINILQEMVL